MLYFSRIGKQELTIKEVNLNSVIEDIIIMMENNLIEANVKILIPRKLPRIVCDGLRIIEVFKNFITNAIKYSSGNKISSSWFQRSWNWL